MCCLAIFSGCTSTPDTQVTTSDEQDTIERVRALTPEALQAFEIQAKRLATACPEVCRYEYDAISSAFREQFKIRAADGTYKEVLDPTMSVPWSHLKKKVEDKNPESEPRAVLIHYGLGDNDEMVIGLSVVILTRTANPDVWSFDTTAADFYIVEAHRLIEHKPEHWAPFHKRYMEKVLVERVEVAGDNFVPLLKECDHRYYGLPWEAEFMWLGKHNTVPPGTNVVFTHAAEYIDNVEYGDCRGYQHIVCAHIEGALTNNPSPIDSFYCQRGVDLGTPCPPRCGKLDIADLAGNCGQRSRCMMISRPVEH